MANVHEKRLFVGAFVATVFVCVALIVATVTFEMVSVAALLVGGFIGVYVLGWVSLAIHGVVTA